jgi:hypothetical protein
MAPELLVLALEFYRAPLRFRQLADPKTPLPPGFDRLFGDLGTALGASRIADTATELGVTELELAQAALFLVRHIMLAPGSDHYRILGLSRDASPQSVRRHYQILAGLLHPDRHPEAQTEHHRGLMVRLNGAYETLRSAEARQRYDATLPRRGRRTRWLRPAAVPTALTSPGTAPHLTGAGAARPRLVVGLIAVGLVAGIATIWALASHGLLGSTAKRALGTGWGPPELESPSETFAGPHSSAPPAPGPGPTIRLDDAQPAQSQRPARFKGALY